MAKLNDIAVLEAAEEWYKAREAQYAAQEAYTATMEHATECWTNLLRVIEDRFVAARIDPSRGQKE